MGKSIWGDRPRINFILKKPGNGRRTFQVLKRVVRPGERPKHSAVDNERLKAINSSLLTGLQDEDTCEIQVRELMADLLKIEKQRLPKVVHNAENLRALQAYWDREYSHRELTDSKAAFNRLARAVGAIGSLSLYSASQIDLQKALNRALKDNRQRDAAAALNQILRFLGRGIELTRRPEVIYDVRYLTDAELRRAQAFVADPFDRLLQSVGFYTGLRLGEIFALGPESASGASFFSQYQLSRELEKRHTKTRMAQRRRIYVLPGGEDAFREWAAIPKKEKAKRRNRKHAEILTAACAQAFPGNEDKHVVFHDLRHSYAIYLVSRGVSIAQVAKCLGNSVQVCQRYYSGFALEDDTLASIKRIIEGPLAQR